MSTGLHSRWCGLKFVWLVGNNWKNTQDGESVDTCAPLKRHDDDCYRNMSFGKEYFMVDADADHAGGVSRYCLHHHPGLRRDGNTFGVLVCTILRVSFFCFSLLLCCQQPLLLRFCKTNLSPLRQPFQG